MSVNRVGLKAAILNSESRATAALSEAVETQSTLPWRDFLASTPHRDGISVLYNSRFPDLHRRLHDGPTRKADWLRLVSRATPTSGSEVEFAYWLLFETWQGISNQLTEQLQARIHELPEHGFILYVTEYLEWCVVITYSLIGGAVQLRVVHSLPNPSALYDIYSVVFNAHDDVIRSVLRNVLKSPAKIVAHRGVLVHVDRNRDLNVFGPTIDTLFLNEALSALLYDGGADYGTLKVSSALDVGSGNGLLTASLLRAIPNAERLVFADANVNAVACTYRNLTAVRARAITDVYGLVGLFGHDVLKGRYDIVVSNPPYVPRPDESRKEVTATGGTDLLRELVANFGALVNPSGAMLLVYSQMARAILTSVVPQGVELIDICRRGGFDVVFDLEEVFEDQRWLEYLSEHNMVVRDANHGTYSHKLSISALVYATGDDNADSIASRVRSIAGLSEN